MMLGGRFCVALLACAQGLTMAANKSQPRGIEPRVLEKLRMNINRLRFDTFCLASCRDARIRFRSLTSPLACRGTSRGQ